MIIYLDIVLLENLLMNYIIIFSTAVICKSRINHKKFILSSFVAGIYSILNYIYSLDNWQNNLIKFLISILMILIAFNCKNIKSFVKQLILFYAVSFIFGGISFMLLFLINPSEIIFNNGLLVGTYPIKILVYSGIIGIIIIMYASKIIRDKLKIKSMICDLEIIYNGKSQIMKTMLDTGNLLKDPITRKQCYYC